LPHFGVRNDHPAPDEPGEDENISSALRAGAISYTLKDISSTELAEIIRKAARRESVCIPE
jgi:DNA-binding NarL/FixJ family response regulator